MQNICAKNNACLASKVFNNTEMQWRRSSQISLKQRASCNTALRNGYGAIAAPLRKALPFAGENFNMTVEISQDRSLKPRIHP